MSPLSTLDAVSVVVLMLVVIIVALCNVRR
jgi:hypothetical protein